MHEQHRKRMRERFLQGESFDSFAVHELLEMFLYYSIPRADTNPIAHELFEHFGSLKGIFNASVDELEEIDGIGKQTAVLIKMIPEIAKRYANEKMEKQATYKTVSEIAQYFCHLFMGMERESLYMMIFNNRMNMHRGVLRQGKLLAAGKDANPSFISRHGVIVTVKGKSLDAHEHRLRLHFLAGIVNHVLHGAQSISRHRAGNSV